MNVNNLGKNMFGFMIPLLIINIYHRKKHEGDQLLFSYKMYWFLISLFFLEENKEIEEEEEDERTSHYIYYYLGQKYEALPLQYSLMGWRSLI